ncbi:hypothetical protein K491DRAFT_687144 [Lophiostoma macrostomum CBS 122681]|uniref:Uncharacterized protein n=1 Tax=Lophiostoma macrostomum CBS 122681 TaxID=1314788 RepID=A0A6A6TPN1_9PLEO|nr:hypothetical protein K491DRAFT_687144 [Lophiostoma macrostomum CBS 122681]
MDATMQVRDCPRSPSDWRLSTRPHEQKESFEPAESASKHRQTSSGGFRSFRISKYR